MFGYLISFHYYGRTDLDELAEAAGEPALTFLVDSGAFSAEHAGATVSVASYAAWLRRWEHRIHAYANLDVLHDHVASRRNLEALRALGLDPLPVFHVGGPMEAFEQCIAESDYVAIGGMVRASLTMRDRRFMGYLARLHERASATDTRLHGFGLSSWPAIRSFPWYSVDSSAPGSGYRYGRIMAYDPYRDTWQTWRLRDRRAWHRFGWLVREYGMAPVDFEGSNVEVRGALIAIAARSWARAAASLRAPAKMYISAVTGGAEALSGPDAAAGYARELMAGYQAGNEWQPRVYVTDAALAGGEGEQRRITAYQDGNRAGTELYLSDPHPSATKNRERIAAWSAGNRWAGAPEAAP